jgi:hypothetical protein
MKFKFDYETNIGLWWSEKEKTIYLNAEKYNLSMDFSECNTLYAKRDSIVFITHKTDFTFIQLVVNNQTEFNKIPESFKNLIEPAIQLVGKVTVRDLLNIKN